MTDRDTFKQAFSQVTATEELKRSTAAFLNKTRPRRSFVFPVRQTLAVCAMLALAVLGGVYQHLLHQPDAYISLDLNPSLELCLNRKQRVLSVQALNEDAEQVLSTLSLEGLYYTNAVEEILSSDQFSSYLREDNYLTFTVAGGDEEALTEGLKACRGYADYASRCHSATLSEAASAQGYGLSLGKYQAWRQLNEYDPSVTAQDCQDMSLSEIEQHIQQHANADHAGGENSSEGSCKNEPDGTSSANVEGCAASSDREAGSCEPDHPRPSLSDDEKENEAHPNEESREEGHSDDSHGKGHGGSHS